MEENDARKVESRGRNGPSADGVYAWWNSLTRGQQVALLGPLLVAFIGLFGALLGPAVGEVVKVALAKPTPTASPTPIPTRTPTVLTTPSATFTPTRATLPPPTSTAAPSPPLTPTLGPCTPTPGILHPPQLAADRLWYTLNDSPEQSVQQLGVVKAAPGDRLCLVRLEYHTDDIPGLADAAHGEAYIHKLGVTSCDGFDYDDGQFWLGDCVDPGANELTIINPRTGDGCWTIEEDWDRLVVALVHNGEFGWEVDHRFFVHLVQLH